MASRTGLALIYWAASVPIKLSKVLDRQKEVFFGNWYLGFTAFGGPPVHFQIFHKKFVEKDSWIDEQMYQELFAVSQALPGPASTKMLFCINAIRGGLVAGLFAFLLWCLPGAIGMYALSFGVARIGSTLPGPVYALLSGLNAATVGIIALAAVQLSQRAITDKLSRALVFFSGVAGMLYSALWYFPVLMLAAGLTTFVWDYRWLQRLFTKVVRREGQQTSQQPGFNSGGDIESTRTAPRGHASSLEVENHDAAVPSQQQHAGPTTAAALNDQTTGRASVEQGPEERTVPANMQLRVLSWKAGACVLAAFVASFAAVLTLRGLLRSPPRELALFANLYLAGTIIFGGGPVVVPLLREYVVAEGWVSPRDFLLGLAIIQAFPGPNFNFAVYLGALAIATQSSAMSSASAGSSFSGALIGFLGIFTPGLVIVSGFMGLWRLLRSRPWLKSLLRGINAAAVGLVYTAVFRLWQIGHVDADHEKGSPLNTDPWWIAITATSYVGGAWFGLVAPLAILLGGVMGLVWYAIAG